MVIAFFWVIFFLIVSLLIKVIVKEEKLVVALFCSLLITCAFFLVFIPITMMVTSNYDEEECTPVYEKAVESHSFILGDESFTINRYDCGFETLCEFRNECDNSVQMVTIKEKNLEILIIDGVKPYFRKVRCFNPNKLPFLLDISMPKKIIEIRKPEIYGTLILPSEPKYLTFDITNKEGEQ